MHNPKCNAETLARDNPSALLIGQPIESGESIGDDEDEGLDEGVLIAIIVLSSLAGLALIVVGAVCAYKEIKRRKLYDKSGVAR